MTDDELSLVCTAVDGQIAKHILEFREAWPHRVAVSQAVAWNFLKGGMIARWLAAEMPGRHGYSEFAGGGVPIGRTAHVFGFRDETDAVAFKTRFG